MKKRKPYHVRAHGVGFDSEHERLGEARQRACHESGRRGGRWRVWYVWSPLRRELQAEFYNGREVEVQRVGDSKR